MFRTRRLRIDRGCPIFSGRLSLDGFTLQNYQRVLTDTPVAWPFLVSLGYSAVTFVYAVLLIVISTLTMWFVYGRSTRGQSPSRH